MSTIDLIVVKDKINHLCQINHFCQPVFIQYPHFGQRIPQVVIGRVVFNGVNWMLDDKAKFIKLSNFVINKLNSSEFIKSNFDNLKTGYFNFDTVNDLNDTEPNFIVL